MTPIILEVPRDADTTLKGKTGKPCLITMIICKSNEIYAYEGSKLSKGKKLNYDEVDAFLIQERKKNYGQSFSVSIKATDNSTYNDFEIVTGKMKNVDRYVLEDLTDEEKNYVGKLK